MSYGGEEYEYEWPDDGQEQDGWGSDGGGENEVNPRVEVENTFYEAEGNMKEKPQDAIDQFEKCI
jgi:hypothetical protein